MIDRIRVMLGLQTEATMFWIGDAADARVPAVEMIAGIKLHARLRRPHLHYAATLWIERAPGQSQRFATVVDNEIVIVTAQLWFELLNARPNGRWFGKVQRRPLDAGHFTGGNQLIIGGRVTIGGQPQFVIQHGAGTAKVEVGMIG